MQPIRLGVRENRFKQQIEEQTSRNAVPLQRRDCYYVVITGYKYYVS